MFIVTLGIMGWVKFKTYHTAGGAAYLAPIVVTLSAITTLVWWFLIHHKWSRYLTELSTGVAYERGDVTAAQHTRQEIVALKQRQQPGGFESKMQSGGGRRVD